MKRLLCRLLLALAAVSLGLIPLMAVAASATSYQLGSTTVTLNVVSNGAGKTYFAPHEDETTAIRVATAAVKKHGGRLYWLKHGGGRNISFTFEGKKFAVDPNRIFTDIGAEDSIKDLSGYKEEDNLPPGVVREVRVFADAVLRHVFSNTGLVVGMHNNTNNNYSVASYLKGGKPAGEASQVSVAEGADLDDFFFTNKKSIFNTLKNKGFNVVLQKPRPTNDGSLSVRSLLPYVNIEAQDGHLSMQKKMLEAMLSL